MLLIAEDIIAKVLSIVEDIIAFEVNIRLDILSRKEASSNLLSSTIIALKLLITNRNELLSML